MSHTDYDPEFAQLLAEAESHQPYVSRKRRRDDMAAAQQAALRAMVNGEPMPPAAAGTAPPHPAAAAEMTSRSAQPASTPGYARFERGASSAMAAGPARADADGVTGEAGMPRAGETLMQQHARLLASGRTQATEEESLRQKEEETMAQILLSKKASLVSAREHAQGRQFSERMKTDWTPPAWQQR